MCVCVRYSGGTASGKSTFIQQEKGQRGVARVESEA